MLDIAGAVPSKDKIQPANQLEEGWVTITGSSMLITPHVHCKMMGRCNPLAAPDLKDMVLQAMYLLPIIQCRSK
ncbi:hypothetical protein SLA2020_151970 [Shorea laevis]